MEYIREPERQVPVIAEADLCVVGGSCTGLFAAVRAARAGLRVILVEKLNCLGGTATAALVNIWHSLHDTQGEEQVIGGLTWETLERLERRGGMQRGPAAHVAYRLNTELLKLELDRYVRESGIRVLFHTSYCAPVTDGDRITHVLVENKSGRGAIRAQFFIDASGDGDLAFHLGQPFYRHEHVQPPTPCYHLMGGPDEARFQELLSAHGAEFGLAQDWGWSSEIPGMPGVALRADTHVFGLDCADGEALSRAELEGRRQIDAILELLRRYDTHPVSLISLPAALGIRESRHFETRYRITKEDLLTGKVFPDTIGRGTYRLDMHHSDRAGITFLYLDGTTETHRDRTSPAEYGRWAATSSTRYYCIPFSSLVQQKYANFMAVGRMLNADEAAFGALRVMVNLNQMGEAAGCAAVCALESGEPVWRLDAGPVIRLMVRGGSLLDIPG